MNLGSPPALVIHTVPFQVCILNERYASSSVYSKREPIDSGVYFKREQL
jgi:hypothetical protein